MKRIMLLILTLIMEGVALAQGFEKKIQQFSTDLLKDKIAGGWAGKMIGVTYGAPVEFKAQGKTFEEAINWTPANIKESMWQDDIYVQLTFMEAMDKYGMDATAKQYQELLAKAGYQLWHANVQARKNYFDGIFPPRSGQPEFSLHADDIDFQIEADYLGFMSPGMPQTAGKMADKIGHIMNYGDGFYGGVFIASLYTAAYFENNISNVIEKALLSLPSESDYAKIIKDVILLHKHYPSDWRRAWRELEDKWGHVNICEAGKTFNIDAKLNGAFVTMGLLYGEGDVDKTMEITTRCGQDADCNPSNAVAVLGIIKGFNGLPAAYQDAVKAIGDSLFIHTNYSFNKAVEQTVMYAKEIIVKNGGTVNGNNLTVKIQTPQAFPFEQSFPGVVFSKRVNVFSTQEKNGWTMKGMWKDSKDKQTKFSDQRGDEIEFTFEGTGVSIEGNWVKDGGKADVFVDGVFKRSIDCYFYYAEQEHQGINIYHILNLPQGIHTVKLVVKGEKNADSEGATIYISEALVYKTSKKTKETYKFSFQ